jgi:ADP-ribose pyrophosphatase
MLQPWRVLESVVTYRDRWLTVRSDRCQTAGGRVVAPFHVLEYPTWINVLALTDEGDVVLVEEYRHAAGAIVLGLPSGVVEPGDASGLAAARRELREETGCVGGVWFATGRAYANPSSHTNMVESFLAVGVERGHDQHLDASEEIAVVTLPLADLLTRAWGGEAPLQAYHLAALYLAVGLIARGQQPELAAARQALATLPRAAP